MHRTRYQSATSDRSALTLCSCRVYPLKFGKRLAPWSPKPTAFLPQRETSPKNEICITCSVFDVDLNEVYLNCMQRPWTKKQDGKVWVLEILIMYFILSCQWVQLDTWRMWRERQNGIVCCCWLLKQEQKASQSVLSPISEEFWTTQEVDRSSSSW